MPNEAPRIVNEWLARLHALTAGGSSAAEVAERVNLVGPMIYGHFGLNAFTRSSLEAVAARCKFWPAYGEIVEYLGDWQRDHRDETRAALTGPSTNTLSPTDRMWIAYWHRRVSEGFGAMRAGDVPSSGANVLSLIRGQSMRAWEEITGYVAPVREARPAGIRSEVAA